MAAFEDSKHGSFESFYTRGTVQVRRDHIEVFHARHKTSQKNYSVRRLNLPQLEQMDGLHGIGALGDEITALKLLQGSPHVLTLHDVFQPSVPRTGYVYMVVADLGGSNLLERIASRNVYTEKDARGACRRILEAVQYMHQKSVVHRGLRPENIRYMDPLDDLSLKISDFTVAKVFTTGKLLTVCGTSEYLAPEVFVRRGYGFEVDNWSCGVLFYQILAGSLPFRNRDAVMKSDITDHPPCWTNKVSVEAKQLVRSLLVVDPKARVTAAQALQRSWISSQINTTLSQVHLSQTQRRIEEYLVTNDLGSVSVLWTIVLSVP